LEDERNQWKGGFVCFIAKANDPLIFANLDCWGFTPLGRVVGVFSVKDNKFKLMSKSGG
jgi:hypothetical protein